MDVQKNARLPINKILAPRFWFSESKNAPL
jgi:hypothetical protein